MSDLKTKPTGASVAQYLQKITDPQQREDAAALARLMRSVTGAPAKMWGPSIVGFGQYRYSYASGREGDWMLAGFSPRKQNFSVYLMSGFEPLRELLPALGKHKTGGCCLYFKRLADIHLPTLRKMVKISVALTKKKAAAAARSRSRA